MDAYRLITLGRTAARLVGPRVRALAGAAAPSGAASPRERTAG